MDKVEKFNEFISERDLRIGATHQIKDNTELVHNPVFAPAKPMETDKEKEAFAKAITEAKEYLKENKLEINIVHSYSVVEIK